MRRGHRRMAVEQVKRGAGVVTVDVELDPVVLEQRFLEITSRVGGQS